MFVKALLQKVFGRGDVGVDAEGFDEAPCADVFMEASCFGFAEGEGYPAKVFGENPPKKGEDTEDGDEAPHAEELGKGDADVDADAACRRPKKLRENAPKLIGCIF